MSSITTRRWIRKLFDGPFEESLNKKIDAHEAGRLHRSSEAVFMAIHRGSNYLAGKLFVACIGPPENIERLKQVKSIPKEQIRVLQKLLDDVFAEDKEERKRRLLLI